MPTLEQRGIVFVHFDQFDQVRDAEVGESHDAVFSDPVDPDDTILDFHFIGDIAYPVLVFTEVFGNAGYCCDAMDLVDVHDQAA
jgi:hypothetical protein